MTSERCQHYLEEPELNASHLQECEECSTFDAALRGPRPRKAIETGMPLAPWEGAAHRAWSLVAAALIALIGTALLVLALAGLPVRAIAETMLQDLPSPELLSSSLHLISGAVQNAPASWQITIITAFILINALFLLLLRRAPRGIDG